MKKIRAVDRTHLCKVYTALIELGCARKLSRRERFLFRKLSQIFWDRGKETRKKREKRWKEDPPAPVPAIVTNFLSGIAREIEVTKVKRSTLTEPPLTSAELAFTERWKHGLVGFGRPQVRLFIAKQFEYFKKLDELWEKTTK